MSLEDIFKNEIQTEAYLNTVYLSVPTYFDHYNQWAFLAGVTDEAKDAEVGNFSGNMPSAWNIGSLTPSFNPLAQGGSAGRGQDRYTTFWAGIRDANVFLHYINDVQFANDEKKARLIAEATLLRAFFYFELIKQFGPMPVVTNPFDPAFDYTALIRPNFQECIDFIVAESDRVIASTAFPMRISVESERGRFTKAVAYMLKSEALLYNASPLWNPQNDVSKWTAAATASKEGLAALTGSGGYALADDYGDYFLNTSDISASPRDRETIFEIKGFDIPLSTTGLPSKEGSWMLGATPSQELVDSYDMQSTGEPAITGYRDADHLQPIINPNSGYDEQQPYVNRDPRFYATVWFNGAQYDNINGKVHTVETFVGGADQLIKSPPNRINTHTGYYLRKFIDPKLAINQISSARFKKYRLAELYLNLAEAANEANGPTGEVYEAINTIRNRVNMPNLPLGLSKEEMRERIHRERRVELVWEEHRFWDVRRWKILHETDKLVTGMEIRKTGGNAGPSTINIDNASFESGTDGWTFYPGAEVIAIDGHTSSNVVQISDGGHVWATINGLTPSTTYEVSLLMMVQEETGYVGVRNYGGDEVLAQALPEDGLKQQKVRFTTGPNSTSADIFTWWPAGGKGLFDDFELVRVGGGDQGGGSASYTYSRFVTERRNAWDDKFLVFPIPITDVSIIPDFRMNQNPGW
ncbi:hypothetical protein GCM10011386_22730 [Parapedobacter defluvii]|uniref:RagB/SusD family nutrient uptake outer membrane protein n=2 Tax=Parapedobacter defluvii TaxID=2045106 RepID=A0ABQ1LZA5_9SPHI|nr:hypothetical protein GCM10011386_22730 [Parapedobacter defluvii]